MSTLPLSAPRVSSAGTFPAFARIAAAISVALDIFVEAQQQAAAAHKRYPFAEW